MRLSHQVADVVLVVQLHGIAHGHAKLARQLLADDGPFAVKLQRRLPHARAHGDELLQRRGVLGHHELHAMFGARVGRDCDIVARGHPRERVGFAAHHRGQVVLGVLAGFRVHAHDGVEVVDLAVLLVDDVVDGVLQAQTRQQQRRAACNATVAMKKRRL